MKFLNFLIVCTLSTWSLFSFGKAIHSDVELQWKLTSDLSDFTQADLTKISQSKIKVEKLTDARSVKPNTRVGEYSENKEEVLPVDTKSDVSQFITTGIKTIFDKAGLDVVEQGAQYSLSGQVKEFYVTETNVYKASILIKFVLKKGDKVVWSGPIQGSNKRFGRTYKLENYMESFSDAVLDATVNLVKNESFAKSWN